MMVIYRAASGRTDEREPVGAPGASGEPVAERSSSRVARTHRYGDSLACQFTPHVRANYTGDVTTHNKQSDLTRINYTHQGP